jgi:hypothetical protein
MHPYDKVLILGNGKSRLAYNSFIKKWEHGLWACNNAFKEENLRSKITALGTVHKEIVEEAIKYKKNNKLNFDIFYSFNTENTKCFNNYHGYSTGNELIFQAISTAYDEIYLLGFDSLWEDTSDIYMDQVIISNFKNQMDIILKQNEYKLKKYFRKIYVLEKIYPLKNVKVGDFVKWTKKTNEYVTYNKIYEVIEVDTEFWEIMIETDRGYPSCAGGLNTGFRKIDILSKKIKALKGLLDA